MRNTSNINILEFLHYFQYIILIYHSVHVSLPLFATTQCCLALEEHSQKLRSLRPNPIQARFWKHGGIFLRRRKQN